MKYVYVGACVCVCVYVSARVAPTLKHNGLLAVPVV